MIFLDNASTTPCNAESAKIMADELTHNYFNPSAKYTEALENYKKLEMARGEILKLVGAREADYSVVFTGSATEANNLVLNSSLNKHKANIIGAGEHSSIHETAKQFGTQGYKILEAPLTSFGEVDIEKFKTLMTPDVAFVSIMFVSNETGAVNDIRELAQTAKKINPRVLIHADAVQGFSKLKINLSEWGIDYLTLSAHKIEGPKGVGALVYKKSSKLEPEIFGGGQENGKRSGTENLPGVLAFINSAKRLHENLTENYKAVKEFKLALIEKILALSNSAGLELIINGNPETASPYILSLGIIGTKGEVLLHALEAEGILVGTGSACNSKHSGNRTLSAMGKTKKEVECNIRLSFSAHTTTESVQKIAEAIVRLAKKHNNTSR